jgi:hypothetical protein
VASTLLLRGYREHFSSFQKMYGGLNSVAQCGLFLETGRRGLRSSKQFPDHTRLGPRFSSGAGESGCNGMASNRKSHGAERCLTRSIYWYVRCPDSGTFRKGYRTRRDARAGSGCRSEVTDWPKDEGFGKDIAVVAVVVADVVAVQDSSRSLS